MSEQKYKDVAVGYINTDKNGKKYLTVIVKEDIKAGDKLFLRKNNFKTEDRHPDYRYSVRLEEGAAPDTTKTDDYLTDEQTDQVVDDIPF